jgi:polyhydroxybutyrate depolymerase
MRAIQSPLQSVCAVLTALTTSVAVIVTAAEPKKLTLSVAGDEREALVFAPRVTPKSAGSPLVFVFHGFGDSAENMARTIHLQTNWTAAYVVYMQGIPTAGRNGPDNKLAGWQHSLGEGGDRDLKFFDKVLDALIQKERIDRKRIYATGFSNGGAFTYVLWEARPDVFAAFAPCGCLPLSRSRIKAAKPAFIISGEKDRLVKIENQRDTIDELRKLNHATSDGKPAAGIGVLYHSDNGTPVKTYFHKGGHVLPNNAAKLIVDFFRAHQQP